MPRIFPDYVAIAVPQDVSITIDPPVVGDSPAFDFNTGEFMLDPYGRIGLQSGREAIIAWIRKTLVTPRFAHRIYPEWYGSDLTRISGKTLAIVAEIEKNIKESLLVDRRIIEVGNFASLVEQDRVTTTCNVVTVLGIVKDIQTVTDLR